MRQIVVLMGATVVFGITFAWLVNAYAMRGATYAALANWLIVSWCAIVFRQYPRQFCDGYYRLRSFEVDGVIYERIGIRCFAAVVGGFPWRFLNPSLRLDHGRQSLDRFLGQSRLAEAAHAVAFSLALPLVGLAIAQTSFSAAWYVLLFDVLFSGYPVILQRYNRSRIERLKKAPRTIGNVTANGSV